MYEGSPEENAIAALKDENARLRAAPTYRDGINRAADEVQYACDRLNKITLGQNLADWLRGLPDDPSQPHPDSPKA